MLEITDARSIINIERLLQQAEQEQAARHAAQEREKAGDLRAGNSGVLTPDGEICGHCHRITYARLLGIEPPLADEDMTETQKRKFFQNGIANEWTWMGLLGEMWDKDCILSESQVPVSWVIRDSQGRDVKVTGRPDIVLVHEGTRTNLVGLELKCISSAWRAGQILEKGLPSSDYLCQTAHYSWQLGIPFILSFSAYSSYFKIKPDRRHFYTGWSRGSLYFINSGGDKVPTCITPDGIKNFYELIIAMAEQRDLGPMFCGHTLDNKGNVKYKAPPSVYPGSGDYASCTKCPFRGACERYGTNHDAWVDAITEVSRGNSV